MNPVTVQLAACESTRLPARCAGYPVGSFRYILQVKLEKKELEAGRLGREKRPVFRVQQPHNSTLSALQSRRDAWVRVRVIKVRLKASGGRGGMGFGYTTDKHVFATTCQD